MDKVNLRIRSALNNPIGLVKYPSSGSETQDLLILEPEWKIPFPPIQLAHHQAELSEQGIVLFRGDQGALELPEVEPDVLWLVPQAIWSQFQRADMVCLPQRPLRTTPEGIQVFEHLIRTK